MKLQTGKMNQLMTTWAVTHRKVSRDPQSDTSSVIDDPRQGGRLKYSERKETESGISETSPTKEVTNNNMSSNIRTPAVSKDSKQSDMSMNRKYKSVKDNMIFDDEKRHDSYTHTTTDRKEKKQTDTLADRKNKVIINGNMETPCERSAPEYPRQKVN